MTVLLCDVLCCRTDRIDDRVVYADDEVSIMMSLLIVSLSLITGLSQ